MDADTGAVVEIEVSRLLPHPRNEIFRQMSEEELSNLAASIAERGFIHPLVVRPIEDEKYEVLSGHQRLRAAESLGIESVPCIVAELDDGQAELVLLDANLAARHLAPMELARAIRRKKELMGEQLGDHRGRPRNESGNRTNFRVDTARLLAQELGMSRSQVYEYDALNELVPELQALVEAGALGVTAGAALARLPKETQQAIWQTLGDATGQLRLDEVKKLKEERERAAVMLDALTRRVQELEQRLAEADGTEAGRLQEEVRRLRAQRAELQRDIEDRLALRKQLERKPGARLLELVTAAVRPLAQARPELEALVDRVVLDPATAANLKPQLETLRGITELLDTAVAKALPPILVSKTKKKEEAV